MGSEGFDVSVLVVDDDETSLATISTILNSLEYTVFMAKGGANALEILREDEGFFDIVITELYMSGMDGLELLKHIESEFKLPVIMMAADRRKNVIFESLANGAKHFMSKPLCENDFKDLWQHAFAARKGKLKSGNVERKSLTSDNIFVQDGKSAVPSNENKKKRKYRHKMSAQMNNEIQSEETLSLVKKQKVVWTTYLHDLFLHALNEIGLEKAVPKKILEVMKVPNLTRENVASHLQKHRIFLKKVADKGLFAGLSHRNLKSRFAFGLTSSMIKDFQEKNGKFDVPAQDANIIVDQTSCEGIINAPKPCNNVSTVTNYVTSTPLGSLHQFPYPNHDGLNMMLHDQNGDSLSQARFGVESSYGNNGRAINIQQTMFESYANPPCYEKNSNNNVGFVFPSNGIMEHGLMTSAYGLRARLQYGDNQLMNQNYVSMGNYHHKFNYGQGNSSMESLNNSTDNLPFTSTYNPSSNIQLNGGSQMVGNGMIGGLGSTISIVHSIETNNNNFSLINETTENTNKNVAPLEQGKIGLAQEEFAFASTSSDEDGWSNDLLESLLSDDGVEVENLLENTQLPQQLHDNVEENEVISTFLKMLEETDFPIEPEENLNANEISMSDFSSSSHTMQSVEQSNSVISDVIANPSESTINLPIEPSSSSDKNPNQLGGEEGTMDMRALERFLVDDEFLVEAVSSATETGWDIDLIEALFDADDTK